MTQPKPLTPFITTDPRLTPTATPQPQERPTERECECTRELLEQEIDEGRCWQCGGWVLP